MRSLLLALSILVLAGCQDADAPVVADAVGPFDLNTATAEELGQVPGVGDRMIHEFEEYRPYASIRQFRREIGKYVDADQVAAYEAYVFVPVDPNASDLDTMQQLPGVGPDEAAALEAGRPYASDEAFIEAYRAAVADGDEVAARAYLIRS